MTDANRKAIARACAYADLPFVRVMALFEDAAMIAILEEVKLCTKLKTSAAAASISVPKWVLRRDAKAGKIPFEEVNRRVWLFKTSDLRAYEAAARERGKKAVVHNSNIISVVNAEQANDFSAIVAS